jgi:hypothetical protein
MMDKALKLSNPKCNISVTEPLHPKRTPVYNIYFNNGKYMMIMMIPSRRREDTQSKQP